MLRYQKHQGNGLAGISSKVKFLIKPKFPH